jgi:hypothetical protein
MIARTPLNAIACPVGYSHCAHRAVVGPFLRATSRSQTRQVLESCGVLRRIDWQVQTFRRFVAPPYFNVKVCGTYSYHYLTG